MCAEQFGKRHAEVYDLIYADRPYGEEVDRLVRIFTREGARRVLDLGCGTGTHAAMLAVRGYEVVGVDRSEPMLEVARGKSTRVRWIRQDLRTLRLGERFDAATAMFTVLGYFPPAELEHVLGRIGAHLRPGGILAFDVWDSDATLEPYVLKMAGNVTRETLMRFDPEKTCWNVVFHFRTGREEWTETHEIYAYSEPELRGILGRTGFTVEELSKRGRDLWVVARYTA